MVPMTVGRLVAAVVVTVAGSVLAVDLTAASGVGPVARAPAPALPPAGASWDYQIGGPRAVPAGAEVVVRDRREPPAGVYDVCYVNGFQTQPDESSYWSARSRRDLVLRDRAGRPVVDTAWGEWLLDIRTSRKRARLTSVIGRWVAGCAAAGYEAVELDNLDSYTRSGGRLERRHAVAHARALILMVHEHGLAAAQKNTVELVGRRLGFDFAVVEDCARWRECRAFAGAYDDRAYLVEYSRRGWRRACAMVGERVSVVRRDRQVTPAGPYDEC